MLVWLQAAGMFHEGYSGGDLMGGHTAGPKLPRHPEPLLCAYRPLLISFILLNADTPCSQARRAALSGATEGSHCGVVTRGHRLSAWLALSNDRGIRPHEEGLLPEVLSVPQC